MKKLVTANNFKDVLDIDEEVYNKITGRYDFTKMVSKYKLSDSFIYKFKTLLDWKATCRTHVLNEKLMHSVRNKMDWDEAVMTQPMSERFITDHLGYLKPELVLKHQKLSVKFIKLHVKSYDIYFTPLNVVYDFGENHDTLIMRRGNPSLAHIGDKCIGSESELVARYIDDVEKLNKIYELFDVPYKEIDARYKE